MRFFKLYDQDDLDCDCNLAHNEGYERGYFDAKKGVYYGEWEEYLLNREIDAAAE